MFTPAFHWQKCVERAAIVLWLMFMAHQVWKTSFVFTGLEHSRCVYWITPNRSLVSYILSQGTHMKEVLTNNKQSSLRSAEPDTISSITIKLTWARQKTAFRKVIPCKICQDRRQWIWHEFESICNVSSWSYYPFLTKVRTTLHYFFLKRNLDIDYRIHD